VPSVCDFQIQSASLGEMRTVTVFLPPGYRSTTKYPAVFCADGQAVHGFSNRLHEAIKEKSVTPVILVGVHSNQQYRAKEYIDGVDQCHFEAHERFFTDDVYHWAAAEFSLSADRQSCAVFGFSNGGAFALSIGAKHRERYGIVIAFSVPKGLDRVAESEYARRPVAKYYLSAGTREKPLCRAARNLATILARHGVEYVQTEQCAGHDFRFWESELPEAIRWSFPKR